MSCAYIEIFEFLKMKGVELNLGRLSLRRECTSEEDFAFKCYLVSWYYFLTPKLFYNLSTSWQHILPLQIFSWSLTFFNPFLFSIYLYVYFIHFFHFWLILVPNKHFKLRLHRRLLHINSINIRSVNSRRLSNNSRLLQPKPPNLRPSVLYQK